MLPPNLNGLVGLIVLAAPATGHEASAGDDTTLGELFRRLAGESDEGRDAADAAAGLGDAPAVKLTTRPRLRRLARKVACPRQTAVRADCQQLDVQLQRAAVQLRRQIVADHQASG